jgi:hypothetical protein
MAIALSATISRFLKKLGDPGNVTLSTQDKTDIRTIINAADHDATTEALAGKQASSSVLTTFAAGTPGTAIGDAAAQANRRAMIGAASAVSPSFTAPTCNRAPAGDNSSLIANTAWVQAALNSVSPITLRINPNKWAMLVTGTLEGINRSATPPGFLPYVSINPNEKPIYRLELIRGGLEQIFTLEFSDEGGGRWTFNVGSDDDAWYADGNNTYPDALSGEFSPVAPATGSDLTITAIPYPGFALGQICQAGETFYSWNGTTWDDVTTP